MTVTHLTVEFQVDGLYEKFNELKILEKQNKYYTLSLPRDDRFPHLISAIFKIYPSYEIVLKIGSNIDSALAASESIITSALFICHKYLNETNHFWRLNLNIPPAVEWIISIPYLYCITVSDDYCNHFNGTLKDDVSGFELTEYKGKHLQLKQKLPQIQLKASQLRDFFTTYNPLKILDLEPQTFIRNPSQNVTFLNGVVTNHGEKK